MGERHEVTAGACPRGIEGGFPPSADVGGMSPQKETTDLDKSKD